MENEPDVKRTSSRDDISNPSLNDGRIAKGGDKDLSEGPVKQRVCTDILWFLIYIMYFGFFLYLATYAFANGRGAKLVYPRDYSGRSCGIQNPDYLTINNKSDLSGFSNVVLTVNVTNAFGDEALKLICEDANRPKFIAKCGNEPTETNSCKQNVENACAALNTTNMMSLQSLIQFMDNLPSVADVTAAAKRAALQVKEYTQKTCVSSCDDVNKAINATSFRMWDLHFTEDIPWAKAWNTYMDERNGVDPSTLTEFPSVEAWIKVLDTTNARRALSMDICPYEEKDCVYIPKPTKKLARYCLPVSGLTVTSEKANKLLDKTFNKFQDSEVGIAFGALEETWWILPIVTIMAFVVGILFLMMLRFGVAIVVWISIVLIFLALTLSGTFMLLKYSQCEKGSEKSFDIKCEGGEHVVEGSLRTWYLTASILFFSTAFIYLLFVICNCKAIRLAILLNKVAARFIYTNKHIVILPVLQVVFIAFWVVLCAWICLYAISTSSLTDEQEGHAYTLAEAAGTKNKPGMCTDKWPAHVVWKDTGLSTCKCPDDGTQCDVATLKCWKCGPEIMNIGWQLWAILFEFFWTNSLLTAIGQTIVAGAVGVWYFNQSRLDSVSPTKTGAKNVFRYHLGSLAFGSLILAAIKVLKWWLRYLKKQADSSKQDVVAKIALALSYCVKCFERCIEFINKNAYIRIALTGENFCKAAWASFKLILRNMGYYSAVGGVTHLMAYVGVFAITIGTTGLGYLLLTSLRPELSPWVCVPAYLIASWLVAKAIITVFQLAVDASLNCYLYDKEMGGGIPEHRPRELADFEKKRPSKE